MPLIYDYLCDRAPAGLTDGGAISFSQSGQGKGPTGQSKPYLLSSVGQSFDDPGSLHSEVFVTRVTRSDGTQTGHVRSELGSGDIFDNGPPGNEHPTGGLVVSYGYHVWFPGPLTPQFPTWKGPGRRSNGAGYTYDLGQVGITGRYTYDPRCATQGGTPPLSFDINQTRDGPDWYAPARLGLTAAESDFVFLSMKLARQNNADGYCPNPGNADGGPAGITPVDVGDFYLWGPTAGDHDPSQKTLNGIGNFINPLAHTAPDWATSMLDRWIPFVITYKYDAVDGFVRVSIDNIEVFDSRTQPGWPGGFGYFGDSRNRSAKPKVASFYFGAKSESAVTFQPPDFNTPVTDIIQLGSQVRFAVGDEAQDRIDVAPRGTTAPQLQDVVYVDPSTPGGETINGRPVYSDFQFALDNVQLPTTGNNSFIYVLDPAGVGMQGPQLQLTRPFVGGELIISSDPALPNSRNLGDVWDDNIFYYDCVATGANFNIDFAGGVGTVRFRGLQLRNLTGGGRAVRNPNQAGTNKIIIEDCVVDADSVIQVRSGVEVDIINTKNIFAGGALMRAANASDDPTTLHRFINSTARGELYRGVQPLLQQPWVVHNCAFESLQAGVTVPAGIVESNNSTNDPGFVNDVVPWNEANFTDFANGDLSLSPDSALRFQGVSFGDNPLIPSKDVVDKPRQIASGYRTAIGAHAVDNEDQAFGGAVARAILL